GRNEEVNFRGERRSNQTHASTSNPDARLYRKGPGMEAKLCYIGHTLMENRNGLLVDAQLTRVSGHAGRLAALDMNEQRADSREAIKHAAVHQINECPQQKAGELPLRPGALVHVLQLCPAQSGREDE